MKDVLSAVRVLGALPALLADKCSICENLRFKRGGAYDTIRVYLETWTQSLTGVKMLCVNVPRICSSNQD